MTTLVFLIHTVCAQYPATQVMQTDFEIIINNSPVKVTFKPSLIVGSNYKGEASYEAYNDVTTHEIHVSELSLTMEAFNSGDPLYKRDFNSMWAIQVLGHEYGHAIQYQLGLEFDEVQASTFSTKAMLNMGYTKEEMKKFYKQCADEVVQGDQHNGHPDPRSEMLQNMENVDHVDELIAQALNKH